MLTKEDWYLDLAYNVKHVEMHFMLKKKKGWKHATMTNQQLPWKILDKERDGEGKLGILLCKKQNKFREQSGSE